MVSLAQARPPFVEFKQVAVHDTAKSLELGYRVTKDIEYAHVMQPGSRDVLVIKARDWLDQIKNKVLIDAHDAFPQEWVNQYFAKYDAWKAGLEAPVNGTHVREWPQLSPAQVQNLISLHILTVEDVSAMTEEAMGRFGMGGRDLREQAREWLAKRELAASALVENEELKTKLAQLTARLEELEADKPKRGRPAKELQAA